MRKNFGEYFARNSSRLVARRDGATGKDLVIETKIVTCKKKGKFWVDNLQKAICMYAGSYLSVDQVFRGLPCKRRQVMKRTFFELAVKNILDSLYWSLG